MEWSMAKRSKKTCRWPRALAEVLLLQGTLIATAQAASAMAVSSPEVAQPAVIGMGEGPAEIGRAHV